MKLLRIIGMGLSGLLSKPFRTGLATLGIVIGVAAVVTLTSLGNGIQKSISGQITDLGPNLITVTPGKESDEGGEIDAEMASTLTTQDAKNVEALPSVKAASPNVGTSALVEGKSVQFSGVGPSYNEIREVKLASGNFIQNESEIVLSQADAKKLLDSKPEEAVGKTVAVEGAAGGATEQLPAGISPEQAQSAQNAQSAQSSPAKEYTVVGVVGPQPGSDGFVQASSSSSYVMTDDALGLSGASNIGQILATATSADVVDKAKGEINSETKAAHGGQKDFTARTQEDLVSTFTQITDQLNIFLAGIAGISLLVGGIGIMNIMLVSVAERTREIGVRKALGATDSDVLLQFLFESVLLALLGGAAGVGLGIGAAQLMPVLLTDLPQAAFGTTQIALAFGVSALIGVLFGVVPAYRSARLAPVEALRRE